MDTAELPTPDIREEAAGLLRLRLYVAGNAPNSKRALANLKSICDEHFATSCDLEVVDMLEHPRRALADRILVTPTLLRLYPLPISRAIGDLSNTEEVLQVLTGAGRATGLADE